MSIVFAAYTSPANDASGDIPLVHGLASGTALNNAGRGRIPQVLGQAQNVIVGQVFPPGNQTVGAVPRVHALATSVTGALALGRIPRVLGTAARGTAGAGALPRVTALANAIAGNLGQGAVPTVLGYASAAGMQPSVSLGYAALPFVTNSASGTAFYPGDQAEGDIPAIRAAATSAPGAVGLASIPRVVGTAYTMSVLQNYALLVQSPGYLAIGSTATALTQALADNAAFTDTLDARFVLALLDLFNGSDAYRVVAQALQALADGATLADIAAAVVQQQLLDALIGSAVLKDTAQLTFLLSDAFRPGDGASMLSQVLEALADSFYAGLTLHSGDDLYTAWVMTPETKAMRSYSNFPFNSYCVLGGQLLGASATGIYRMGSPTDNGAAIQASIRTGLMNLGTQKLKRIDRAYLGATADGNLLLRVQATTNSNGQLQQTYRMTPAQPGVPGEHRVEVGRGFRSVYWTFEIANDVDGADFELYDVQVLPLVLTGRVY